MIHHYQVSKSTQAAFLETQRGMPPPLWFSDFLDEDVIEFHTPKKILIKSFFQV